MDRIPRLPEIVINHATVRERWGMADFIGGCAERGLSRASIWGDQVDRIGSQAARALMDDHAVAAFGYNRAGPLIAADRAGRSRLLDDGRRAIDQAVELGADHVLVFSGGLVEGSRDLDGARAMFGDSVGRLLEHARAADIRLALEPLHPMLTGDRAVVSSLSHANDICDRLGTGIGIVIDVYHVWWDERLAGEIQRTGRAGRILGFHVNDWLVPTSHILRDRGMMGDGIIDLAGIWRQVVKAGYAGPIEVEIFSDRWWGEEPGMVLDLCLSRCRQIFTASEADS